MMIAVLSLLAALAGSSVSGVVKDASGAVVPGASIVVRTSEGERVAVSGADGRFTVETPAAGSVTLIVRAPGFAEKQQVATAADGASVTVVLDPAGLREDVTVTATRTEQRLANVAASVNVLRAEDIRQSPAVVADDVLRELPTFSLFRRTSSLSSHPTAQGVSLRGIGPSGVSRTLVLLDGVPFNDPFGGWVYWTRVPLEDAERIEVVDSSTSSLYGNYAMGGVININTSKATRRTVEFKPQYGNNSSPKFDLFGSDVWGKVGVTASGSFFDTTGFPIVIENERGAVDDKAAVNFKNTSVKAEFSPTSNVNTNLRFGYFREKRANGKHSTIDSTEEANDTSWKNVSGGVRLVLPDSSDLQANISGDFETFNSNFLAVPAATPLRSLGRMTLNQNVPTTAAGGMVQWSKPFTSTQLFQAGLDWHWVSGDSNEDGLDAVRGQTVTLHRVSGGSQRSVGFYVQDMISPAANLTVTLSARVDHWSNYDAHNLETNIPAGTPTATNFPTLPGRDDTVVSPRAAAIYHVNPAVSVWGDIGSGFRAPTLNELYRQFRVGTVLTLANNLLSPERLVGGELGVNLTPAKNLNVRLTWFDNRMTNPVASITIATAGANVTQQRQNVGKTEIQGFQADAEYRMGPQWRISGGYLFNSAKVEEFAANPALVGNYLPQVPQNRVSYRVSYVNPKAVNVTFGVLGIGRQFDDDQNVRIVPGQSEPGLPGYATTDLTVSRNVTRNVDVYFGAQNLFNQEYIVGTLPTTIGSPRLVNGGFRIRFSGR
jgi:outer membrane receptor protein involved in Fe transport